MVWALNGLGLEMKLSEKRVNTNYQKELDKFIEKMERERAGAAESGGTYRRPRLLLHSCCAPCSSYCMEYLREYFDVTVFYYNPNITEEAEYRKRVEEEKRLIAAYNAQVDAFRIKFEAAPTNDDGAGEGPAGCAVCGEAGSGDAAGENGTCSRSDDTVRVMEFPGGIRVTSRTAKIGIIEGDYDRDSFWELSKGLETCPEGGERCFKCYELRLRRTAETAKDQGFDLFTTTLTISPLKNAEKLNEIGQQVGAELGIAFLPSDFKKRNGYKRSVELSAAYDLYRQDYCGCVYSKQERLRQIEQTETRSTQIP